MAYVIQRVLSMWTLNVEYIFLQSDAMASLFFSLLILAELIFKGGYCSRVAFIIFGETGGH